MSLAVWFLVESHPPILSTHPISCVFDFFSSPPSASSSILPSSSKHSPPTHARTHAHQPTGIYSDPALVTPELVRSVFASLSSSGDCEEAQAAWEDTLRSLLKVRQWTSGPVVARVGEPYSHKTRWLAYAPMVALPRSFPSFIFTHPRPYICSCSVRTCTKLR